MRVTLNSALSRPAVSSIPRVERDDIEPLRYIKSEPDGRAPRRERERKRFAAKDERRFASTPSETLTTTLVELQIAALPQDGSAPETNPGSTYSAWSEN